MANRVDHAHRRDEGKPLFRFFGLRGAAAFAVLATLSLTPCPFNAQTADPASSSAAALHYPTNEDLRRNRTVTSPVLSPDGRSALVVIADTTADGGKTHLWLIDTAGGPPRQLTFSPDSDKRGEHSPAWMPDGQTVLFVGHRGEHTALYQLPMRGGEAKAFDLKVPPLADTSTRADAVPLNDLERQAKRDIAESGAAQGSSTTAKPQATPPEPLPADVDGFVVAPDGKRIGLLLPDPQTPGEKRQTDAKADAAWVDHDPHQTRLYLLEPATGTLTATAAPGDVREVAWSPDSTQLVAVSEPPNGAGDLQPANAAVIIAVARPDGAVRLTDLPGTVESPAWSRDGKRLEYLAQSKQDAPPGVHDLYDYTFANHAITDRSGGMPLTLAGAGPLPRISGEVDQLAESGFDTVLLRFPTETGAATTLRLPLAAVNDVNTNERETGWLVLLSDSAHPPTLLFTPRLGETAHALALPPVTAPGMRGVEPKRIRWMSDGFSVEGMLFLPEAKPDAPTGSNAGAKVPLVVEVHGGPTGRFQDGWNPLVAFLVGQGWAVLQPNPRGSTGRGATFASANHNDLGGGDLRDIMAGVDFVLKTEPVDPQRLALIGYSYGGEMAGFAEGHTDRFKAIVSAAPVIDQFSEYATEKGSYYDRWFYGYPWQHAADAWRQSPLAGVATAKTPMMLLQGESDATDPLGQSQEMYRALRQQGVTVDLVTYPREDHGPLARALYGESSTEPWHGFDARQRIVRFLHTAFGDSAASTH